MSKMSTTDSYFISQNIIGIFQDIHSSTEKAGPHSVVLLFEEPVQQKQLKSHKQVLAL